MFAIIRHGYGKKQRFAVHEMTICRLLTGKIQVIGHQPMRWDIGIHKTEAAAREAAEKARVTICACGDFYECAKTIETINA